MKDPLYLPSLLANGTRNAQGYTVKCPVCGSESLLLNEGDGEVLNKDCDCDLKPYVKPRPPKPERHDRKSQQNTTAGTPTTICLADVKPESVTWLWTGWIPIGKLTLLVGDPGLGKTMLAMDLAARVSAGKPMPLQEAPTEAANVIIASAEDGLADTLLPRLKAAGADLKRVHGFTPETLPSLSAIADIEAEIRKREARLLILDPLFGFLPVQFDSHKDQHVRQALQPLAAVAQATGCAVLIIHHPNKQGTGTPAIYRAGGSIGIVGACRAVLMIGKPPDDPNGRVLTTIKMNLCEAPQSIAFHIASGDGQPPRTCWDSVTTWAADDLVSATRPTPDHASKTAEAVTFLQEALKGGPRPSKEVETEAKKAGISHRTLDNARKAAGILSFKDGSIWHMRLSDDQERKPTPTPNAHASSRPCAVDPQQTTSRTQQRNNATPQEGAEDCVLDEPGSDDWEEDVTV